MKEDGFRAFLGARLATDAAKSVLSCARRVERIMGIDLDTAAVDAPAVTMLKAGLVARGVPKNAAASCASAVRHYGRFRGDLRDASPPPVERQSSPGSLSVAPRLQTIIPADATTAGLMRLYADVLAELRRRGVTRTANGPVGDYAELLFARAFCWTLADNSAAHYDAIDVAGIRYQVKARRIGTRPGSRQLGALRRLPERNFDILAAVLFDRDMQVSRAALIPYETVAARAKRVDLTNSWRFMLSDAVWALPEVRDPTAALRATALAL